MAKIAWWLIVCSMFDASLQFFPNTLPGITDSRSQTHYNITELAIGKIAISVINDSSTAYPSSYGILSTDSFREAVRQLTHASAEPDLSAEESTNAEAHFDSEQFITSSRRIADLRRQAISAIKQYRMKIARNFAGRALHTLQDFYSHSNWIELGNTDPHPGLNFRGFTGIPPDTVAHSDQPTCSDCNRFLHQLLLYLYGWHTPRVWQQKLIPDTCARVTRAQESGTSFWYQKL